MAIKLFNIQIYRNLSGTWRVEAEIDPDSVKQVQGMNITIVTTARTDDHCKQLLALLGVPFAGAASGDKQA